MTIDHTGNIVPRRLEAAYMARYDDHWHEAKADYIPTPEDVVRERDAIRDEWSKSEEKRRRVQQQKPWTPPHGTAHISETGE